MTFKIETDQKFERRIELLHRWTWRMMFGAFVLWVGLLGFIVWVVYRLVERFT